MTLIGDIKPLFRSFNGFFKAGASFGRSTSECLFIGIRNQMFLRCSLPLKRKIDLTKLSPSFFLSPFHRTNTPTHSSPLLTLSTKSQPNTLSNTHTVFLMCFSFKVLPHQHESKHFLNLVLRDQKVVAGSSGRVALCDGSND